jgi:hypothetical protein
MHRSDKAKGLKEILHRLRGCQHTYRYELWGAGSCFSSVDHAKGVENLQSESIRDYFDSLKLFRIFTRDRIAQRFLSPLSSRLIPCPSYFSIPEVGVDRSEGLDMSLVYVNPVTSISGSSWRGKANKERLKTYQERMGVYARGAARVYVTVKTAEQDIKGLGDLGYEGPISVLNTIDSVRRMLATTSFLVTARVHIAMPSIPVLGRDNVKLIGIDTRAKTAEEVGGIVRSF